MLVDHHCHSVLADELDGTALGALITESDRPPAPGTSPFDSAIGLAVRRWCPPLLGLPALAEPADYLEARRATGAAEATARMLAGAGLAELLVDTGLTEAGGRPLLPPGDLAALAGARLHEVVRLEAVAAEVRAPAPHWPDAVAEALAEACAGAVAVKSVLAYRAGLDIPGGPPTRSEVVRAAGARPPGRITDPVLLRHLLWTAVGLGLPIQLHTGFGDPDLQLHRADPALLVDFVRAVEPDGVPLVLLHGYPYHRQAAWLTQAYPHVYADVGLTLSYTGPRAAAVLGEVLELAPFGKVLASTDAYGLPELYPVGASQFRRALATLLDGWQTAGDCTEADALRITEALGSGNARRLYRI
ncbi:amidohydrolase family protein [Kitasatospora sp. DSM 101779]|uniref:amidohydrolase family protein n=1 Tax=Kitasatospora sp. DSM 101779 TaxID=2853165 RepID=UPI0021D84285|nr:amidohydrolase family protein [Kitasatospora sp. DSM 101779]MCU7822310.1 amidohydrolase family protein [Kitasatospora sp. DSM 101779]